MAEGSIIDLLLLADAQYFVGQFSSAFSLIAFDLSVARYSIHSLYWYKSTNTDTALRPSLFRCYALSLLALLVHKYKY